ncbi:MAG: hypothetical protein DCC75_05655 [Proteobacteria bacterium]|nr:MAG: hypothetical protein DCC75_05655 [Pseudomonadota bacterium]
MSKRVLVVDDDPVVRILVTEFLNSQGYQVETVASGADCLERLSGGLPDVLVVDLLMPEMSGIELLGTLRGNPDLAKVPVVMMSSDADTQEIAQTQNLNADCYLQKPFGMKEILAALEAVSDT